jgi:hypothetical protein
VAGLITFIKNLSYNLTNFLIGKAAFFIVILGWFFVIMGLIFLIRPEQARASLVKRGLGTIKWGLSFALFYVALLALSLIGRIGGGLSAFLSIGVIIALVWLYFYLTGKSLKVLREKIALVPVKGLRVYAVIQIVVGILMITLQRRIW